MDCVIPKAVVYEQSAVILMARLIDASGDYVSQAAISSITCKVFDKSSPTVAVATPSIVVATSIFDTLQTPALLWTVDSLGFNFKHVLPASALVDGSRTYSVEYAVTPTGGELFRFAYELSTLDLFTV